MSGAIYGFARSADRAAQFADRAAQFADPHISQLICRSRNHRQFAQPSSICASICQAQSVDLRNLQIAQRDLRIHTLRN